MLFRILHPDVRLVVVDEVRRPLTAVESGILRAIDHGNKRAAGGYQIHLNIERFTLLILRRGDDVALQPIPCAAQVTQELRAEGIVAEVAVGNAQ